MDISTEVEARPARRRRESTPIDPEPPQPIPRVSAEDVSRRAYELFLERGAAHGGDVDDWLRAEQELGGRNES